MNALPIRVLLVSMMAMTTVGCNSLSLTGTDRPMAFHDTRLQYALLTNDQEMLGKDFDMHIEPSISERALAGLVLPFGAAIETVTWPIGYGITTYLNEFDPRR
jgi:uncharacterized protein YceK